MFGMRTKVEALENQVKEMQAYKATCELKHSESDNRYKRIEDKIVIQAADIAQIRTNTDALVQGDLLKKAGRQFVFDAAKMLVAVSTIIVFFYNAFDILAKALKIYIGMH